MSVSDEGGYVNLEASSVDSSDSMSESSSSYSDSCSSDEPDFPNDPSAASDLRDEGVPNFFFFPNAMAAITLCFGSL